MASHASLRPRAQVKKDKYDTLDDILATKLSDKALTSVVKTMFDACGTITEALREELVTVAEKQESVFGDVQLGVDVLADELMWKLCKTEPLIKDGASEEESEAVMCDWSSAITRRLQASAERRRAASQAQAPSPRVQPREAKLLSLYFQ